MKSVRGISVIMVMLATLAGALVAIADLGNVGFAVLIIVVGCASGVYAGLNATQTKLIMLRVWADGG